MRLPAKARATKDIDLIVEDPADEELTAALRKALEDRFIRASPSGSKVGPT